MSWLNLPIREELTAHLYTNRALNQCIVRSYWATLRTVWLSQSLRIGIKSLLETWEFVHKKNICIILKAPRRWFSVQCPEKNVVLKHVHICVERGQRYGRYRKFWTYASCFQMSSDAVWIRIVSGDSMGKYPACLAQFLAVHCVTQDFQRLTPWERSIYNRHFNCWQYDVCRL